MTSSLPRRVVSGLLAATVAVALLALPVAAEGDVPCPRLGQRADAIAFFTGRGFPAVGDVPEPTSPTVPWARDFDHDGVTDDGTTWTSQLGPMTATVVGKDVTEHMRLRGVFWWDYSQQEGLGVPWSAEDLSDAMTWSAELIEAYLGDDRAFPRDWMSGDMFPAGTHGTGPGATFAFHVTHADAFMLVNSSVSFPGLAYCGPAASAGP